MRNTFLAALLATLTAFLPPHTSSSSDIPQATYHSSIRYSTIESLQPLLQSEPADLLAEVSSVEAIAKPTPIQKIPQSLTIPKLKLDTTVIPTGLNPDRTLAVPDDAREIGWYDKTGPTVLVSHNEWKGVKGLFYNLKSLTPNDVITITDKTGIATEYVINAVEAYDIDKFPTNKVYKQGGKESIRLITCHGTYDKSIKRYTQNLIVFATAKESTN